MNKRFFTQTMAIISLAVLFGCGANDPLNRQAVSGRVLLDGQPLDHGSIQFRSQDGNGQGSGTVIEDGEYAIPADKGLPPGKYIARLYSVERSRSATPSAPPGFDKAAPKRERIPAQYNSQSSRLVEVSGDGSNRFDFDIRSR